MSGWNGMRADPSSTNSIPDNQGPAPRTGAQSVRAVPSLRDFCKAKAEVIGSRETSHRFHEFHIPEKER
jgi:hypothetical protein